MVTPAMAMLMADVRDAVAVVYSEGCGGQWQGEADPR
jgi:hypothetical protein